MVLGITSEWPQAWALIRPERMVAFLLWPLIPVLLAGRHDQHIPRSKSEASCPCMAAQPWPGWEQLGSARRVSGEGTEVATLLGVCVTTVGLHVGESKPSYSDQYVSNSFFWAILARDIQGPSPFQPVRNQLA